MTKYRPTSVSPPGWTLQDLLEERGISQSELAQRLQRSIKHISEIANGKATLSSELALDLERVLGTPARFWIAREAIYREWVARMNQPEPTEDELVWARQFPYREMSNHDWVPEATASKEKYWNLLRFFGLINPQAYEDVWLKQATARFRCSQNFAAKTHLIAAWLRQGERLAEDIPAQAYSENLFKGAVTRARSWTNDHPNEFVRRLRDEFAATGVILLFVPELKSMGISGATRWLTAEKAQILITLRFKTNDHLWFTIFHECCHILKHPKKDVFLENNRKDELEREADDFAAEHIIPMRELSKFVAQKSFTTSAIRDFAARIGIAPGIVVGRLQHEKYLRFDQLNGLKVKYQWSEDDA